MTAGFANVLVDDVFRAFALKVNEKNGIIFDEWRLPFRRLDYHR